MDEPEAVISDEPTGADDTLEEEDDLADLDVEDEFLKSIEDCERDANQTLTTKELGSAMRSLEEQQMKEERTKEQRTEECSEERRTEEQPMEEDELQDVIIECNTKCNATSPCGLSPESPRLLTAQEQQAFE